MKKVSEQIHGYTFGTAEIAPSPVSLHELESLKVSVGFTNEDPLYLALAGEVLADQTQAIVLHWRSSIIANIPHLARHSRSLDGQALPDYLSRNLISRGRHNADQEA